MQPNSEAIPYAGLSTDEAESKLTKFGLNDIKEKETSPLIEFLRWFVKPVSLMIEVALILSFLTGREDDAAVILFMLVVNVVISFYHEYHAENSIKKLKEILNIKSKVIREGKEYLIDSTLIVPGDIIVLERGDVVPADLVILESSDFSVDESMLTGESFPVQKGKNEKLFSTSIVKRGKAVCEVSGTGRQTYFGKTLKFIETDGKQSLVEKDVLRITKFLMAIGVASMIVLSVYFLRVGRPFLEVLNLAISLAIVSFPIALPTVITLVTSIGVYELSNKHTVVRRLASLEDLSNTEILFTDKTGTITKNEITASMLLPYGTTEENLLQLACAASDRSINDVIDGAILKEAENRKIDKPYEVISSVPASSESRKSQAKIRMGGKELDIIKGAYNVIESEYRPDEESKRIFEEQIRKYSGEGYKIIAVAYKEHPSREYKYAGLILLLDPPRDDAKEAIRFIHEYHISVKMLTGDNRYIASKIASDLGIGSRVFSSKETARSYDLKTIEEYDVFAELYPEDKYGVIKRAKEKYIVAVTGDGVNDIPAIKEANIGIAVSTATDATKSSADVVLLSPGISVIKDALVESKKIIHKIYYYSVYRISESFRVLMTILFIGLWLGSYPLTPLQLILLSLLNDLPIIAIAFDKVQISSRPEKIDFSKRTRLSLALGSVGLASSLLMLWLAMNVFHLSSDAIQTAFFLKLSIGGHFLLLVARAENAWYKSMPSKTLLSALIGTQILASMLALFGVFMPKLEPRFVLFVWAYTFLWMQISDTLKIAYQRKQSTNAQTSG
ncbi:Copper-exporting P-type ATPase B [uncultured archaeon]|nr:Copper-exporting P-type ATPase B [uncultured archaeon]